MSDCVHRWLGWLNEARSQLAERTTERDAAVARAEAAEAELAVMTGNSETWERNCVEMRERRDAQAKRAEAAEARCAQILSHIEPKEGIGDE